MRTMVRRFAPPGRESVPELRTRCTFDVGKPNSDIGRPAGALQRQRLEAGRSCTLQCVLSCSRTPLSCCLTLACLLTFDTSGRPKAAKQAMGCPFDGGVRLARYFAAEHMARALHRSIRKRMGIENG